MALVETHAADLADAVAQLLNDAAAGVRWFRGQGCHHRPLRPSLVRRLSPFTTRELLDMENRLITRFRQRSLPYWPEGYPQDDWEQLFAMQHFGVPTRLLDWSENAVMAAFFAADHDVNRCECSDHDCRPTLWVLDPIALNRRNSRLDGYRPAILATSDSAIDQWAPGTAENHFAPWPVALFGTHNSPRIVAQQGTFTVSGKEDSPLESVPAVKEHDGVLRRIVITADHDDLMTQLRLLGINRAAVYRDLGSLSSDISTEELGGRVA